MTKSGDAIPGKTPNGQRGGGRKPVDSKTRARVRKLAREGMSRNAIARSTGVSTASVTKICSEARPPITFDRKATAAATEAVVEDLKARRARIAAQLLDQADKIITAFDAPHEVTHWDKDGDFHRATIKRPTTGDIKNYAVSLGILLDKHLVLIRADGSDMNLPAVDAWLESRMPA